MWLNLDLIQEWAGAWQNKLNDLSTQQRLRSAWAVGPVWSVFALRTMDSLGPKTSSGGKQRLIRLGGFPGWSEVSLGAQVILLLLSSSGLWCLMWYMYVPSSLTVMILSFRTDMPGQTVQTQIRLLLEEQSDQGLHCLSFRLHRLDSLLYDRATWFTF